MIDFPSQARLTPAARKALTTAIWGLLAAIVVGLPVLAFVLTVDGAGDATREVLFNVGHWLRWLLYVSTFVVFAIIATGPLRKAKLWRLGRTDEKRWDRVGERLKVFAVYGVGQGRLTNDLYAAVMHLFIFWGWVVLFIGTLIIALHADVVYFLEGRVYLAYSAVLDAFGVLALIGLSMALLRRYVLKPPRMRLGSLWDDEMLLWLMFAIVVSGFLIEGLRIGATELISGPIEAHGAAFLNDLGIAQHEKEIVANPDWAPWSPVGYALAKLFDGLGISTADDARHAQGRLVVAPADGAGVDGVGGLRQDLAHHPGLLQHLHAQPLVAQRRDRGLVAGADQGLRDGRVVRRRLRGRLHLEAAHGHGRLRALRPLRGQLPRRRSPARS